MFTPTLSTIVVDSGRDPTENPTNVPSIVGGVVGGITALCLFTLGVLHLRRRERSPRIAESAHNQNQDGHPAPAELPPDGKISELQSPRGPSPENQSTQIWPARTAGDFESVQNMNHGSVLMEPIQTSAISELPGSHGAEQGEETASIPASQPDDAIEHRSNTEAAP